MAKAAGQAAAIREIFSAAPAILGWSEEAHAEIEALVDEDAEAVEALRGRTFARTLQ